MLSFNSESLSKVTMSACGAKLELARFCKLLYSRLFSGRDTHDLLAQTLDLPYKTDDTDTPPVFLKRRYSPGEYNVNLFPQPNQRMIFDLYLAAQLGDVPKMAKALAEGARIEYQNPRGLGSTSLIRSTIYGNLMASEFLMQNGANIDTGLERSDCASSRQQDGQNRSRVSLPEKRRE